MTNAARPGGQPRQGYISAYAHMCRPRPGPASRWAERLDRAGLPYRHEEWTGGHDQVWWEQQLPVALGWLLG